jgi:hypothetical protein
MMPPATIGADVHYNVVRPGTLGSPHGGWGEIVVATSIRDLGADVRASGRTSERALIFAAHSQARQPTHMPTNNTTTTTTTTFPTKSLMASRERVNSVRIQEIRPQRLLRRAWQKLDLVVFSPRLSGRFPGPDRRKP